MDMQFGSEDLAFRDEVRQFIADNLPVDLKEKVQRGLHLGKEDYEFWQKKLNERGWFAPHWPVELGGVEWRPTQHYMFQNEQVEGYCPSVMPFGVRMVAPVIFTYGNDEQKQRFLPDILDSSVWWCQGYSEPGSGSDLASLQTKAVRDGDHYVVNGTKTWTTLAQHADWIFCLVRTSGEGKPQEGISFLLIDMKSPGIEITPIITIDGSHEVNSVFFTDVRVPVENLIGEENKGWTYAKFLLLFERSNSLTGGLKQQLHRLRSIAAQELTNGQALLDEPGFAARVADYEVQLRTYDALELRTLGKTEPGAEASYLKILGTDLQQLASELTLQAVGYYGNPFIRDALVLGYNEPSVGPDYAAPTAPQYFNYRKTAIYAGSNEIQRNILSKAVLGM
ncbi:MAG: pimeloyl-CoA dehydrogenase large subunit [Rhodospirillaceae bacterium]|jgi:alkylation response protein AidB-like acyl-CoA dehydrogenase|nr:pimeloyl-CoA dehydrogenase large subunit [Rhodospirillaceae bacterium]MBT4486606.1 pimeloyl-CoA dehydrogenase large subunit [Rhodospirillaceae bacterium]MBT5191517.1 pimeloyl-CoA dehydrogenase large subunit [Rhodospirillaceae bacterium]MBT5898007.1 pimeloyl-CoA dehydrogenase large subunit [Rhodospirillaceae bacterium]MBT6428378.1 pimeloyl-CoA dehydrogenase large subunit [Rhodospirillaceae bacterium]